jgi:hypothetical protein
MLPRLAQAFETLFGDALRPAAGFLRAAAVVALLAVVGLSALRALLLLRAIRFGWETGVVVRCPECRRLIADPDLPTCPSGHPIRFPRGTAGRERRRRRVQSLSRAAALAVVAVPAGTALAAAVGFGAIGVARMEGALASLTAALAYLFLASAVGLAGLALTSRPRGWTERALSGAVAVLCLFPAFVLALLARGFEPSRPRTIGHLWKTPTALYVSSPGGRGRRVGEPSAEIDAELVDVQAPAFGVVWEGLARFRAGERVVNWKGEGGTTARLLEKWAAPLSRRGVFLQRSTRSIFLPPNLRTWIVAEPGKIRFGSGGDFDLTRPATPSGGPLRRNG